MGTVSIAVLVEEIWKGQQLNMSHDIEIALRSVDAGIDDMDRDIADGGLTISCMSGAEIGVDAIDAPRNLLRFCPHDAVRFDVVHPWMSVE
jgi:hypothetical protein